MSKSEISCQNRSCSRENESLVNSATELGSDSNADHLVENPEKNQLAVQKNITGARLEPRIRLYHPSPIFNPSFGRGVLVRQNDQDGRIKQNNKLYIGNSIL